MSSHLSSARARATLRLSSVPSALEATCALGPADIPTPTRGGAQQACGDFSIVLQPACVALPPVSYIGSPHAGVGVTSLALRTGLGRALVHIVG